MTTAAVLWGFLRCRPWLTGLNLTLAIIVAVIDLLPGPLMRAYFDGLTGESPGDLGVEAAVALLLLTALVRTVVKTNSVLVYVLQGFNVNALARRNVLAGILAQPGARALSVPSGVALNSLRDDAEQTGRLVSQVVNCVALLLFSIGALAVMVRIDAALTLVVFLPLAAIVAIAQRATGRLQLYRQASRAATARVTGVLGELFESIQAIQLAGAGGHAVTHLDRLNTERQRLATRDSVLGRVVEAVFENTVNLGTGLILLLAGGAMRAGTFSVGDFALFAYYLTWVSYFVQSLGSLLVQTRQAGIGFERLSALAPGLSRDSLTAPTSLQLRGPLPRAPHPVWTPTDRFERLDVRNLSYEHPDSGRGITNISFSFSRGQIVVVTGRVGSGKTTLVRSMLGLLPQQDGSMHWNGIAVVEPAGWFVPPHSAYTPQAPRLFSESLRDNILLGLDEHTVALDAAIHTAVLEPDIAALPDGMATLVGPRGVRLSGGQVQRAAAARMLVRSPELIVVDDLSSALDVDTEQRLWQRLFDRPDITAVIVSNRRAILQRADLIVVLKDGALEATGRLPALLDLSAELRHLWHDDPHEPRPNGLAPSVDNPWAPCL